jgi:hypothetical protein
VSVQIDLEDIVLIFAHTLLCLAADCTSSIVFALSLHTQNNRDSYGSQNSGNSPKNYG